MSDARPKIEVAPRWHDYVHAADATGTALCRPVAPLRARKLSGDCVEVSCDLCLHMLAVREQQLGYMQGRGAS